MIRPNLLWFSVALLVASGCSVQPAASKPAQPQPSTANLEARLKAAQSILNSSERDDALAGLANDAANAGEGSVTLSAIGSILSLNAKNAAASTAAASLAKAGNAADGIQVANQITSSSIRDETLAKIAKGQ